MMLCMEDLLKNKYFFRYFYIDLYNLIFINIKYFDYLI